MSTPRLIACFALIAAAASGCIASPTEESDPAGDLEEEVGEVAQPMKGHNSLSLDALGKGALTANPRALDFMRHHSLAQVADGATIFEDYPEMRYQLNDPGAREAMRYIVSCALEPNTGVNYDNPIWWGESAEFLGEHGLCPAWRNSPPTEECLELVSACVLARVNKVGARVPLSLRGPSEPLRSSSQVRPEDTLKDHTQVASFAACSGPSYGPNRTCGWQPVAVGQCVPDTVVTVGAGAGASGCGDAIGSSWGDTMLRICKGIYGCDPTMPDYWDVGLVAANDDRCGLAPAVTFTCPASGYYSVMGATYDSSQSQEPFADPNGFRVAASSGSLAATEQQVWSYVEGAFYGNIFRSDGLAPGLDFHVDAGGQTTGPYNLIVPTIFRHAHACYSPIWRSGAAELTSRMCAGPSANCLMRIAGACGAAPAFTGTSDPVNRCQYMASQGDYRGCLDRNGSQRWYHPVTTYLNNPCDTVAMPGAGSSACRLDGATLF